MKAPRTPRGEKPATTIRLLRRQLKQMESQIGALKLAVSDKEKVIAGYDVQLSETDDELRSLKSRIADQAMRIGELTHQARQSSERAAFLEGYYAKSQEAATPREKLAFLARTSARNARGNAAPETDGEGARHQGGPERQSRPARGSLRLHQAVSESLGERRATARGDIPAPAAEAWPSYTGNAPETGFDPGQFALTAAERLDLERMKHADRGGITEPRTPYRGVDGPLF